MKDLAGLTEKLKRGGEPKYHERLAELKKLFARKRIELLCDKDSFVEDGLFANCLDESLAADGVVTGLGMVAGRRIALMANDSTIKAGSWGARTVEKIIRIQETAGRLLLPLIYLVDSAGARITDQVEMFPGRRGAGRIFYNEANLSGKIPQICALFGPSAAGGAYIPAFCDVVVMVEGNASMYLGSPRMAEAVIGEKVSLEEMGGARMHCSQSGCGDFLVPNETAAIEIVKRYLSYMPQRGGEPPVVTKTLPPEKGDLRAIVPDSPTRAYDMHQVIRQIVDAGSVMEIKELYAKELITVLARIEGRVVGVIANQPLVKGGVIFSESANKAARFIQICNAYGLPILFVEDVPGFMIGSQVERNGIIRAGAKMIHAMSTVAVPKIALIVRKAFGAGLYAMSGPAFASDCVMALPTASIAVMGPEPAVNAVYFNKMETMSPEEKKSFVADKVQEYEKDIDLKRMGSELIVDHLVDFPDVRKEIAIRMGYYCEGLSTRLAPSPILPM